LSSLFPAADFQLQFTRFVASPDKSLQANDRGFCAKRVARIASLLRQIAVLSSTRTARRV